MEKVSAWAPIHATFIFATPKKFNEPLKMGSLGAGVNFGLGMETTVDLRKKNEEVKIFLNEQVINGEVTKEAIKQFRIRTRINPAVNVYHNSPVPTGYGLSTSGAGAIGTLLALNQLYDTQLSDIEILQMAHITDIICQTGLGSVLAQSVPGFELRIEQGAPGIGKVKSFALNANLFLVPIASLSTPNVLKSKEKMDQVTTAGMEAINRLLINFSLDSLFQESYNFLMKSGLCTPRIATLVDGLHKIEEFHVTMAMIGETIVIHPNNPDQVQAFLSSKNLSYILTNPSTQAPHVIST